jgi:hypothetical protein
MLSPPPQPFIWMTIESCYIRSHITLLQIAESDTVETKPYAGKSWNLTQFYRKTVHTARHEVFSDFLPETFAINRTLKSFESNSEGPGLRYWSEDR